MEKNLKVLYGEIISRAWEDEEFKNRFLASPGDVLREAGIPVEEGVEYKVVEVPKLVQYLVLPHEGQQEALQGITKMILSKAEKDASILPEGVELRIIQNTASLRYLVFPSSPKTLSAAELKLITGGDSVSVYSDVVEATTLVTTYMEAVEVSTTTVQSWEAATTVAVVAVGVIVLI